MNVKYKYNKVKQKLTLGIVVMIFFALNNNDILLADEYSSVQNSVGIKDSKVSTENFTSIQNTINSIKKQLGSINMKLDMIRDRKEYTDYPAVRLNVDTPIFGLVSLINKKSRITTEVSAADVTSGYSLNYVANKYKVKVPSFTIASFVIMTREVDVSADMSNSDANIIQFKLLDYLEQAKNVNQDLDNQINSILGGYISQAETQVINTINDSINKINQRQISLFDQLNKLELMQIDSTNVYIDRANQIKLKVAEYEKIAKNKLTDIEKLKNIQKQLDELELDNIKLCTEVDSNYNSKLETIDANSILTNINTVVSSEILYVKNYINNSENKVDINNLSVQDLNANELKEGYVVTSKEILEDMKVIKTNILNLMPVEKFGETQNNETFQDTTTQTENVNSDNVNINDTAKTYEENQKKLQIVNKLYLDFLNKENRFIKDNLNLILSDSKNKLKTLSSYTNADVIGYSKYIYIDVPMDIQNIVENTNLQSENNIINSIGILKIKNNELLEYNVKITKLHNNEISSNNSDIDRSNKK